MNKNKIYDSEFRKQTIELVKSSDKKVSVIARDLGVPASTIHTWLRQQSLYKEKAFPGKGNPRDKEMYELKKQLADVQMERDILKKAIAFSKNKANDI